MPRSFREARHLYAPLRAWWGPPTLVDQYAHTGSSLRGILGLLFRPCATSSRLRAPLQVYLYLADPLPCPEYTACVLCIYLQHTPVYLHDLFVTQSV